MHGAACNTQHVDALPFRKGSERERSQAIRILTHDCMHAYTNLCNKLIVHAQYREDMVYSGLGT